MENNLHSVLDGESVDVEMWPEIICEVACTPVIYHCIFFLQVIAQDCRCSQLVYHLEVRDHCHFRV